MFARKEHMEARTLKSLLQQLESEGIKCLLNLVLEAAAEPSHETLVLVREHREDLLTQLALRRTSDRNYYLKIETASHVSIMARPHHIREAMEHHPWGVVWDSDGYIITRWGDVPESALLGKLDLVTGQLIVPGANLPSRRRDVVV